MALPETAGTLSLERVILPQRAPVTIPVRRWLPFTSTNIAPLATHAVSAALVGFAAEYLFRALVNGSVARLPWATRRSAHIVRTVTTELTVVERIRRR